MQTDAAAAARYLSARLSLPLVALPVLGGGVALALVGWIWSGLAVLATGIVVPRVIKRSAPHFILTQAIQDANLRRCHTRRHPADFTAGRAHAGNLRQRGRA